LFVEFSWLIPLLPIFSFIICLFFGKYLKEGGGYLVVASIFGSFIISVLMLYEVVTGTGPGIPFESSHVWIDFGDKYGIFEVGILIDHLSAFMLTLVSLLCLLIVIYSIGYMAHEESKSRYYAEISLFVVGMLGMVISNNFLQFLIFWEVMGLCSYLLIGFWYEKPSAASAAKKAFLVTRVGDMFFLAGIAVVFVTFGTTNFHEIQVAIEENGAAYYGTVALFGANPTVLTIIALLLFGGTVGKSGQFPLHIWLPDAMEGPTTVSALIHAATMVKAGIYLLARSYPIVATSPDAALFVASLGALTAIITASMALVAYDIKKVLAYSTLSQLGYMVLGLGTGAYMISKGYIGVGYTAALFHLMNHAFFKALLFLCAGSVIHAVGHNDMRGMGGLHKYMKITSFTMLFGCISIAGVPFISGFWSKDELLAAVYSAGEVNSIFIILWIVGTITALMTAFYMFRLWFMTFSGKYRGEDEDHLHESPLSMTGPLMILGGFALVSGIIAVGLGGFGDFIVFHPHNVVLEGHHVSGAANILSHTFSSWLTYVSIGMGLLGIFIAYNFYNGGTSRAKVFTVSSAGKNIHSFLSNRMYINYAMVKFAEWGVDGTASILNWFDKNVIDGFINGLQKTGLFLAKVQHYMDRTMVEGVIGVIEEAGTRSGNVLRKGQTGRVADYAGLIVIGVVVLLILINFIIPNLGG
jgi:NADH-quinone oxidoreductase subunit L